MRIVAAFFVLALLGGVQLGCASASRDFAAPRITVENVVALSSSAGQQRFRVSLAVDNPNTEPLPIKDLEFKLRLADQGILDGRLVAPVTVAALDRQTLTLELSSDIISSLSRLLSFVQGPANALPYEIYGTLTLDRAFKEPIVFSARGQVPLTMTDER